ncbi:MAG: hypothetical protein EPN21_07875 [Methylococcaceae bacterium]|nr:MAG: hypothetical protein EPN21_07875 [Methylococcaceae bacterium]
MALLISGVKPPAASNKTQIVFMTHACSRVSGNGKNRYHRANCSLFAVKTSLNVGYLITTACRQCRRCRAHGGKVSGAMTLLLLLRNDAKWRAPRPSL